MQADASKYGIGATLIQNGKPIAYVSKSLTASEVQYAKSEKEMLAILFGCKRYHHYLYGKKVNVQTDHKPLEVIVRKLLSAARPCLQCMLLHLQGYDLNVYHVSGKNILLANILSRKFITDSNDQLSEGMDVYIHTVMKNIPFSDERFTEIA